MSVAYDEVREREKAFTHERLNLQAYGEEHSTMGNKILASLWTVYERQLHVTVGNYEDFNEFIDAEVVEYFEDPDYLRKLVLVVDRAFRYVHEQLHENTPVRHPKTHEKITVDKLIGLPRFIGKLITISQCLPTCTTDAQKRALFDAAFLGTRIDVQNVAETIQEEQILITIPFIERVNADGTTTCWMENLDGKQVDLVIRRLGKLIVRHLD